MIPGCPAAAPLKMKCNPMSVLPEPEGGKVTPAGIRLQLSLTHEMLGRLIGARRPTVTLALKELAEQNSVIRQDSGWLITGRGR